MDLFDWPEAPPASRVEQRPLPFPGTAEQRFAAWRDTPDGGIAFEWMRSVAVRDAEAGAKRLSAKALVERCRALHRVKINNDFTPLVARAIQEEAPLTRGLFRDRLRRTG